MNTPARALAQFIFGRDSISSRLEKSAFIQGLAQWLHVREWINGALARRPLKRQLTNSNVKYNIETFEALSVERMYFGNPIYTEIFSKNPVSTFMDLGCNSGIFPCFLAHIAQGRPLSGLCVDANAEQVALAEKSARLNQWENIYFRHGLAGSENAEAERTEFFIHPTSLGSSQFAYAQSESGIPPAWKAITVPNLNIEKIWNQLFGEDSRCDCLKIDIEGSEMFFFKSEASLLARVDSILLEWHQWGCSRDEVVEFLRQKGFTLYFEIEHNLKYGVLYFRTMAETRTASVIG